MEAAVGTTPLHSHATPVPALLISHPQPRAMRAVVTPQGTTLDQPRLCPLVAPLLGEAGCPRPSPDLETSSPLSITKVNDGYSGDCFNQLFFLIFVITLTHVVLSLFSKWKSPRVMWRMTYPRVQRRNQTPIACQAPLDWTLIMTTQLLVAALHTQNTGG